MAAGRAAGVPPILVDATRSALPPPPLLAALGDHTVTLSRKTYCELVDASNHSSQLRARPGGQCCGDGCEWILGGASGRWRRVIGAARARGAGATGGRGAGCARLPRPFLRRHDRAHRGEAAEQALVPRRQLVGDALPSVDSRVGGKFTIHRLDLATQTWVDTGVAADTRESVRLDALSDGNKLYVASSRGERQRHPQPQGACLGLHLRRGGEDLHRRPRLPGRPRRRRGRGGRHRPGRHGHPLGDLRAQRPGDGDPHQGHRHPLGHALCAAGGLRGHREGRARGRPVGASCASAATRSASCSAARSIPTASASCTGPRTSTAPATTRWILTPGLLGPEAGRRAHQPEGAAERRPGGAGAGGGEDVAQHGQRDAGPRAAPRRRRRMDESRVRHGHRQPDPPARADRHRQPPGLRVRGVAVLPWRRHLHEGVQPRRHRRSRPGSARRSSRARPTRTSTTRRAPSRRVGNASGLVVLVGDDVTHVYLHNYKSVAPAPGPPPARRPGPPPSTRPATPPGGPDRADRAPAPSGSPVAHGSALPCRRDPRPPRSGPAPGCARRSSAPHSPGTTSSVGSGRSWPSPAPTSSRSSTRRRPRCSAASAW